MGKSIRKIVNWKQYNQALVSRGFFWVDEDVVKRGIAMSIMADVVAGLAAIVMWRLKPR